VTSGRSCCREIGCWLTGLRIGRAGFKDIRLKPLLPAQTEHTKADGFDGLVSTMLSHAVARRVESGR